LAGHTIAVERGFEPEAVLAKVATDELDVFGADVELHRSPSNLSLRSASRLRPRHASDSVAFCNTPVR
jgi:hypothetical protein